MYLFVNYLPGSQINSGEYDRHRSRPQEVENVGGGNGHCFLFTVERLSSSWAVSEQESSVKAEQLESNFRSDGRTPDMSMFIGSIPWDLPCLHSLTLITVTALCFPP